MVNRCPDKSQLHFLQGLYMMFQHSGMHSSLHKSISNIWLKWPHHKTYKTSAPSNGSFLFSWWRLKLLISQTEWKGVGGVWPLLLLSFSVFFFNFLHPDFFFPLASVVWHSKYRLASILTVFCCCGDAGSSLLHTGFLSLQQAGASHCGIFFCCGAQALSTWASVVAPHRLRCGSWSLEHGPSSCGTNPSLASPWHVGSFWTRDWTCVPCSGRGILNNRATKEVPLCLCISWFLHVLRHLQWRTSTWCL